MSDHTRVEFRTYDGITLRGDFFPAEGTDRPVVVMAQGLTLLKEHYIDDIARRFQAAGSASPLTSPPILTIPSPTRPCSELPPTTEPGRPRSNRENLCRKRKTDV